VNAGLRSRIGSRTLWLTAAACLAIAASAVPKLSMPREVFRYLFVFDITQSMNVRDYETNGESLSRLEAGAQGVEFWLARAPCGSEAGVAIFSGHRSFLLLQPVEVCGHYGEFKALLTGIDWRMAWRARSEVAKGLDSALLLTKMLEPGVRLVFLSDGHEAPPISADYPPSTKAVPGEVQGLVVGLGGDDPHPIPLYDRNNRQLGYWRASDVLQVDTYSMGRASGLSREHMVGVDVEDLAERIAAGTEHLSTLREGYLQSLAGRNDLAYHRVVTVEDLAHRLDDHALAIRMSYPAAMGWLPATLALFILIGVWVAGPLAGRRPAARRRQLAPPGTTARRFVDDRDRIGRDSHPAEHGKAIHERDEQRTPE